MKFVYLLFLTLLISGCEAALTNDQIIAETQKCKAAGLRAEIRARISDLLPYRVVCLP